jgi:YesN/AraC family two-component response regulator
MTRRKTHGLINKARDQVMGTDAVSRGKELEPDLEILDVRMPELNSVGVRGNLRYASPKIRLVL